MWGNKLRISEENARSKDKVWRIMITEEQFYLHCNDEEAITLSFNEPDCLVEEGNFEGVKIYYGDSATSEIAIRRKDIVLAVYCVDVKFSTPGTYTFL